MLKVNNIEGFKPVGRNKRKKQIVLTHTSRNIRDYISSLKYRYNGSNKKLPHYIIDRNGEVFNVIPPNTYSEFMDVSSHNKQSIIINLENLGWLRKNPLKNSYINWIGNEYSEGIYERKWRGYHFWQPYTQEQIDSLLLLIDELCLEFDIPKVSVGHNVKLEKVENFNGITSKSNYNSESTDLNPAFDFDIFINKTKDE
jgi:N-acetyl-anhydromuramyl-L-alanine amidase AmpD